MNKPEVKELLEKADSALETKNFQKAIEIASQAIELDPKNPMCYLIQFLAEHEVTDIDQLENKEINFDSDSYKNIKLYTNKKLFREFEASLKKSECSDYSNILNKVKSFFELPKSNIYYPLTSKILFFISYFPSLGMIFLFFSSNLYRGKRESLLLGLMIIIHGFFMWLNYKLLLEGSITIKFDLTINDKGSTKSDQLLVNFLIYVLGIGLATLLILIAVICIIANELMLGLFMYVVAIAILVTFSNDVIPKVTDSIENCS